MNDLLVQNADRKVLEISKQLLKLNDKLITEQLDFKKLFSLDEDNQYITPNLDEK